MYFQYTSTHDEPDIARLVLVSVSRVGELDAQPSTDSLCFDMAHSRLAKFISTRIAVSVQGTKSNGYNDRGTCTSDQSVLGGIVASNNLATG
jgi:hypothetical protein